MKKTLYFIFFVLVSSVAFGQYIDTTGMRGVEQNKSAFEGDMYLDTNALIYKIGLTHGRLGWLTDHQSIDSIKVLNDSLFFFIERGNKLGIPLDLINPENEFNGMQYYIWDTIINISPEIDNIRDLGISANQGKVTGLLNDATRNTIISSLDGSIVQFLGSLSVDTPGTYSFNTTSDDGARIYIDDVMVLDSWNINVTNATASNSVYLEAGDHKVEFWYFTTGVLNFMEFSWGANPAGYTGVINASQFNVE